LKIVPPQSAPVKDYVGYDVEQKLQKYIKTPVTIVEGAQKPTDFESFYMKIARKLYGVEARYPRHLQRLIDNILGKSGAKTVTDVPRRHSKTTTILACYAFICFTEKRTKQIFATYSDDLAKEGSEQFDSICRAWADAEESSSKEFGTNNKRRIGSNVVYFLSLKGSCVGRGANRNITIDDPLKNELESKSIVVRDTVYSNITTSVLSGAEFERVNRIVCGTRWHADDPQARFLKQGGWVHVSFPAIMDDDGKPATADTGRALWPEARPMGHLLAVMADMGGERSFGWQALMQGCPPVDGFSVFRRVVRRISELGADWRSRIAETGHGIDLAYSRTSSSDMSAFATVHRLQSGEFVIDPDHILERLNTDRFLSLVTTRTKAAHWYGSHAEIDRWGEIYHKYGLMIEGQLSFGKLGNAQNLARLWNAGRVFVPDEWSELACEGVQMPLPQILGFTGIDGDPDDMVDACSSAIDQVSSRQGTTDTSLIGSAITIRR
jgi:phage terminase large subunit-like protein